MFVPKNNFSQPDDAALINAEPPAPKGVVLRIFGVILIFLGSLDLMLFWRGGIPVSFFHVLLLIIGAVFYTFGAFRNRYHSTSVQS